MKNGSRRTTNLEVLGLPLAGTWVIVPAPGWDAKDGVGGEGEEGDRLGGEHGYLLSTTKRRDSREWESERGTGSFGGARGEKSEEWSATAAEGGKKRSCEAGNVSQYVKSR